MAKSTTEVGHSDVGTVQRRWAGDYCGVIKVSLAKSARISAKALAVDLNLRAHLHERIGEAEAVFLNGLVNDRKALGLG